MTNKKTLVIILALSALVHFAFFGHPNQTVFDEVHFGKFISGYFTGQYFFDIHPPLGKLLISGLGYLSGFEPGFSFTSIGEVFPNSQYLWLRLLPALAGTLLPLIIFLLALELGLSRKASFLAALLVIFENALIVQSRFILLDSFLLLFGFSSLLFYFKHRHSQVGPRPDRGPTWLGSMKWLILASLMAGLAASVKWTGLSFLGLILVLELTRLSKSAIHPLEDSRAKSRGSKVGRMADLLKIFLGLIFIPLTIYTAIFVIHLSLLPKSGPGDAFMSPEFQKTLAGNMHQKPEIKGLSLTGKLVELNKQMYQSNQRITAAHPYGSKWYSWPFMVRSVFFWQEATGPKQEKIYLLGNPFVWWTSTVALLLLLLSSLRNIWHRKFPNLAETFLMLGFFINLLPFIGIKRVMFLYHYFPSLIFAILAFIYLVDKTNPKGVASRPYGASKKSIFALLLILSVVSFLFFSPFTYGLPLTPKIQNYLFWFASWR